jgi:hypothetical protein
MIENGPMSSTPRARESQVSEDLSNDARILHGRDQAQARGRSGGGDESRLRQIA